MNDDDTIQMTGELLIAGDAKLRLASNDMTISFRNPATNEEVGTLSVVWKRRFFGRWGRATPRVAFTGNVEPSAKLLFDFMIPMANRCCKEAES